MSLAELVSMRIRILLACLALSTACGESPSDVKLSIESLQPNRGPVAGGNLLVLRGTGLAQDNLQIRMGGRLVADPIRLEDGGLQFVAPAGQVPGEVDLLVSVGDEAIYLASAYEYNPTPTISSIVPDRGYFEGTTISLVGTGFMDYDAGDATIELAGAPCTEVSVESDTIVACVAPTGIPWTAADVTLTNNNGEFTMEDGFRFMKSGLLVAEGRGGVDGSLFYVDLDDDSFRPIAKLDSAITGIAVDAGGVVYGVTANAGAIAVGFPRKLVTIDPFTGAQSSIGDLLTGESLAVKLPDIAIDYDSSTLYGWTKPDNQLVTVSLDSGRVAFVGGAQSVKGGGMAFDLDGALYLSPDGSDGSLQAVTIANGNLSEALNLSDDTAKNVNSLTYVGSSFFAIREGVATSGGTIATYLLEIDDETGVVIERMTLPFGGDALTATPNVPFL